MTSADIEAAVAAAAAAVMGMEEREGGPREFCDRGASSLGLLYYTQMTNC